MTLNETKQPAGTLPDMILLNLRAGLSFMAKVAIATLLILAAGILAVATAIVGLVIAGIALLLRFVGRGGPRRTGWRENGTVTLEAHRTAHGWRVE
ncbi:MAG: hypothetical protein MRY64_00515 [Hyphomonadaceae bacterium]|nr:hypothetical protein [Hyphomonadaceae bacterium]